MLAIALSAASVGQAQVTTLGNNSSSGDYVGCDNTSPFPLRIMQNDNYRIEWYTDAIRRMLLQPTLTSQTIGTYTALDLSDHLGVGLFSTTNVTRPFSLLHIDHGGNQFSGFRPWHKTGVTFTRGTDLGYVGLKHEANDVNSMTVCWADNTLGDGPDRLKFILLAQPIFANGTAGTLNGLEAVRIAPAGSGNQSFFGIGDWLTTGSNVDPRERLDILDGRVRIRRLPDDPAAIDSFYVMVVDRRVQTATNQERGVVKWVDPSVLTGGGPNDCDRTVDPNGTSTQDICTAYSGSPCPWDNTNNVGIGTTTPIAKLELIKDVDTP